MRPSLVIALSLTGAAAVGYGVYLYLQGRAVRALLSAFEPPPAKPSPQAEAMRARLAALAPSAPLRDWLQLMSEDRDSVTLDAAIPSVAKRAGVVVEMRALLTGTSREAALLALRWLAVVPAPEASLGVAAEAAIARFATELPRRRASDDDLFAAVLACETLQNWQMGNRATCAALTAAIAALGGGDSHAHLLHTLAGLRDR